MREIIYSVLITDEDENGLVDAEEMKKLDWGECRTKVRLTAAKASVEKFYHALALVAALQPRRISRNINYANHRQYFQKTP